MITAIFLYSLAAILLVLAYPAILVARQVWARPAPVAVADFQPPVSVIVAVRNAAPMVEAKLRNCLALDYPAEKLEIVFSSDGSTDETLDVLQRCAAASPIVLAFREHRGKTTALNDAVAACRGEVLVFTDVAAALERGALRALVRFFADVSLGGVGGRMQYTGNGGHLGSGQRTYLGFDVLIRRLENRSGSVTANNGLLYAIRRSLFRPFPDAVTDDLFACLSVVRQGYRFAFAPEAVVVIPPRVKNPRHEITRRRRIVSTSLRSIWLTRAVLNPFRFGFFSFGLGVNKVLRRLLPVHLLLLFTSSLLLAGDPVFLGLFAAQFLFYGCALFFSILGWKSPTTLPGKVASAASYFLLGNVGTLLGLIDFLRGKAPAKWEPVPDSRP